MEFNSNKQYIHYSKSRFIYYFYTLDKTVYVKIIKNNKAYSNIKISENTIDYCVDIDDFGVFHLVSISLSGDLKYCIYRDNKWDCRYLTKYDAKSYQFKNLKLFISNNSIHILIAISNILNSELWTLKHHYWNNKSWINKKVCDISTEKYDIPFHADIDSNNNIHIVFKSLHDKKYQIYYCRYNTLFHSWSVPIIISNISQNNSHPFILCDNANGAHISWSGFYKNNLKILYIYNDKINSSKNCWGEIQGLSNEGANSTHPFIFKINNSIKVLWKQNNNYFTKIKNIFDNTWSNTTELKFEYHNELSPISVIGNNYKTLSEVSIPHAYGVFSDGEFFIFGIDTIFPKDCSISKTILNTTNHATTYQEIELEKYESNQNMTDKQDIEETKYITKQKSDNNKNIDEFTLDHQIIQLLDIIQDIQKKQESIHKLLDNLNKQQEQNILKIDTLTNQYSSINTNFRNSNNSFWIKFKNFFK